MFFLFFTSFCIFVIHYHILDRTDHDCNTSVPHSQKVLRSHLLTARTFLYGVGMFSLCLRWFSSGVLIFCSGIDQILSGKSAKNVSFYSYVGMLRFPVVSWLLRVGLTQPCCSMFSLRMQPRRGRQVVMWPVSAAERSARRQRDEMLAGRSHYRQRTRVVIWSKQKRKKRQACHPFNRHIF